MNWYYFICIGWWAGLLWITLAIGLCLSIIGWPVGMAMAFKADKVFFGPD